MAPDIPQRISLVADTAQVLKQGIAGGRWIAALPGERTLGRELQISRGTLRAALRILLKEGSIRLKEGRYRIVGKPSRPPLPGRARRVACIAPTALDHQPGSSVLLIDELRRRLHKRGVQLDYVESPQCYTVRGTRRLAELVAQNPYDCWILLLSTQTMQRWFQNRKVPAIVAGSVHAGVVLPSVGIDFRAVGRHAGGLIVGCGHRRVALLAPIRNFLRVQAGILEAEAGLREAVARRNPAEYALTVVHHKSGREHVVRAIDQLLSQRHPPSVLLIAHPPAAVAAITYLAQLGLLVPRDISIVCTQDEPYFNHVVPAVTHYEYSPEQLASLMCRVVLRALQNALEPDTRARMLPHLVAGDSLATAPEPRNAVPGAIAL